jgi:hypothetical protein
VLLGMLPPEVVPLRIRTVGVRESDAEDSFHDGTVFEGGGTQLSPILPLAALDHIVDCGPDISHPVIQMPMQHGSSFPKLPDTHVTSMDNMPQAGRLLLQPYRFIR